MSSDLASSHAPAGIHILVYVGLLLLVSQAGGRLAVVVGAPRVFGYLLSGLFFGPPVLGVFHQRLVREELTLFTDVALALIAFSIGGSLRLERVRRLGKPILWITLLQAVGAGLLVTFTLSLTIGFFAETSHFWTRVFPPIVVLGAVSAATAPAPILGIVRQYRSRGPLTTILLGVVALDDALTILFFTLAITAAKIVGGTQSGGWLDFAFQPVIELGVAVTIGGTSGLLVRMLVHWFQGRQVLLGVMLGVVLLAAGLAASLGSSAILTCMVLGFMIVNIVEQHDELFQAVEDVEEPIFGLFFALAGAHLDPSLLASAGALAILITAARFSGKLLGTRLGAQIAEAPDDVRKYLGLALLPKAGVTIGLILQAKAELQATAATFSLWELLISAVLASTVINELLSPFLVRYALRAAGEIPPRERDVSIQDRTKEAP